MCYSSKLSNYSGDASRNDENHHLQKWASDDTHKRSKLEILSEDDEGIEHSGDAK